uniref:Uncharacterized protein n=1 Tax=Cacopsylla melanoneura TaxID=428564 RepID=A0A8D8Q0X1_9HEMI
MYIILHPYTLNTLDILSRLYMIRNINRPTVNTSKEINLLWGIDRGTILCIQSCKVSPSVSLFSLSKFTIFIPCYIIHCTPILSRTYRVIATNNKIIVLESVECRTYRVIATNNWSGVCRTYRVIATNN